MANLFHGRFDVYCTDDSIDECMRIQSKECKRSATLQTAAAAGANSFYASGPKTLHTIFKRTFMHR